MAGRAARFSDNEKKYHLTKFSRRVIGALNDRRL